VPLCASPWRGLLLPLPLAGAALEAITQASIGRPQLTQQPIEVAMLLKMLWFIRRPRP
jgi:hypothetical protein